MATFHVFVDGPVDASPGGVKKLAAAIAASYGLPAADLESRLSRGRFRVKANVDQATAQTYAKSLESLGARVTLEDAQGIAPRTSAPSLPPITAPAPRPSSSSLPPATTSGPRPHTSSLPPATTSGARPQSSSLPPATAKPKAPAMQSGLAAAFSGELPAANLGALEHLSLASLDGQDDAPAAAPASSFAPPAAGAAPVAAPAKAAPLDLFAPPEAQSAELDVQLADDEIEHRAKRSQSLPPATVPAPSGPITSPQLMPSPRRAGASIQPASSPVTVVPDDTTKQRTRFAAGVLLSILLGFLPAHVIASARERSTYRGIDTQVEATQAAADTPEMYAQLDAFRAAQLDHKKSEQRNIALISLLVWAAAGGAVAFGWFRLAPWNRTASA